MHQEVNATIIVLFSIVSKDLSTPLDLDGTTSDHSMSKSTNTTKELKMVIWTGSSLESSLPSWVQLKIEMQTIGMDSILKNT